MLQLLRLTEHCKIRIKGDVIETHEIAELIATHACEKQADNVLIMDMSRVSGICDFFVICSATSSVRAKTIAEHIESRMKREHGIRLLHREGLAEAKWVLLDFGDVVVHIFKDDIRKYYNLENLWGDAPRRHFAQEAEV